MALWSAAFVLCAVLLQPAVAAEGPCEFVREFAPGESIVKPQERPYREAVCLNGRWQFQPVAVPREFRPNQGKPPELPPPQADS